ncbi:MAG: ABC transporter ATP-binding protein [Nanoarchaeota archaeon]|nr:ABC transporter ATP-binding protein [Nanoarchaeota archaeon]
MAVMDRKKIDFKYNWKIYVELLSKYKKIFVLLMFLVLVGRTANIADKFLFKVIIDSGTGLSNETIPIQAFVDTLIIVAVVFVSINLLRGLIKFASIHILNRLDGNLIADLKRKFFNHLIGLSYRFHTSTKTGSLISKLIRGGGSIEGMTDVIFFNFAPLLFEILVAGASLMYFNWVSALTVFGLIIAFISYSLFIQRKQEPYSILANDAEDVEKANISDFFTNIDSIKYFGKEPRIKDRFKELSEASKNTTLKHWDYYRFLDAGQVLIVGIGTILLLYFPLMDFLAGNITIGTLVFIYTVFVGLVGPLFGFVHGVRRFYRLMANFESLFKYAKIENEVKDKPGAKELEIKEATIEFKNVSFVYPGKKEKLFKNFDLKINTNEKVALVGRSGCGKSTLIKLLYRLYDVNSGKILIDGQNIRDFKKEGLRSEMSIVPQEAVLFDDTIYNNIAFSKFGAVEEEVWEAMKFARLTKLVNKLPKKERTVVGERGVKLSGGEKQRVSIARALLADKKILVLDEATSSLDSKTEFGIQQDLDKLLLGRTAIIIAHRLSTVMKADKIVVMDEGRIVQIGSHEELIKQKGVYKELWDMQRGGYLE